MVISDNMVVSLSYHLHEDNAQGKLIEKTGDNEPLVFIYGGGNMLPEFEANLKGLAIGDSFSFALTAEQAYGLHDEEAIAPIDRSIFAGHEDMLHVGAVVPMSNEDQETRLATILEIDEEVVVMDFNHPMAGIDLFFKGEIVGIRPATASEIDHGHVHGEGGVHH